MKRAYRHLILLATASLWMSGCEVNLGQKVKDRITYLQTSTKTGRTVEIAQIDQDLKAEIQYERDDHQVVSDTKELRGWKAVRPDVAKALGLVAARIINNQEVKVITEDGKNAVLDVGGWYVVPPAPKPEPKPSPGE